MRDGGIDAVSKPSLRAAQAPLADRAPGADSTQMNKYPSALFTFWLSKRSGSKSHRRLRWRSARAAAAPRAPKRRDALATMMRSRLAHGATPAVRVAAQATARVAVHGAPKRSCGLAVATSTFAGLLGREAPWRRGLLRRRGGLRPEGARGAPRRQLAHGLVS